MGGSHGNSAGPKGDWPQQVLRDQPESTCLIVLQVSFISPQEAVFAQERGVPIIDVRPAVDHYCSRIPGSIGIPFMRSITGMLTSPCAVAVIHMLYGIQAVWYTSCVQLRYVWGPSYKLHHMCNQT